jgi:hypothetical protein
MKRDPAVYYRVRVGERYIVGFRNVPDGAKVVLAPGERAVADCCIAQLGRGDPYEWSEPNAAHFIANRIGGSVESVGGPEPPEGWDAS